MKRLSFWEEEAMLSAEVDEENGRDYEASLAYWRAYFNPDSNGIMPDYPERRDVKEKYNGNELLLL